MAVDVGPDPLEVEGGAMSLGWLAWAEETSESMCQGNHRESVEVRNESPA